MNVVDKALKFAIKAHKNQVRKAEKEKPYIVHPIDVANILKRYNCPDNLIAAGLLHDILEDTDYDYNYLKQQFGESIANLVNIATEQNKNSSWEERKLATIKKIKGLSLNEKLLLCADKISNLEDIQILFNIKGKKDFSSFKRGKNKQYWYYYNMYINFVYNANHPMFDELNELIIDVFQNNIESNSKYYFEKDILKMSKFFNEKIIFDKKVLIYYNEKLKYEFSNLEETKKFYIDRYNKLK